MPAAARPIWPWPALAVFGVLFGLLQTTSSTASAHPLGNFTVNRYARVEVASDGLQVRYVLDLAEIPSVQETHVADVNHDGVVSATEWDAYRLRRVEELRNNLSLAIDGQTVELQTDQSVLSTPPGQANIPLIRIEAWFRAPSAWPAGDPGTQHWASFQDRNEPGRLGWREIVVEAGPGVQLTQSSVPSTDTTDELRSYPERALQDPLDVRQASWAFAVGGAGSAPRATAPAGEPSGRPADPFTSLITAADLNPGVVLVALLAAATLGGVHAASPGHGKTVMAAYIVGTRGNFLHAVVLGLSVTASHTFGVLVLGVITVLASNLILPEQLYPWLTLVAALVILVFSGALLVGSVRKLARPETTHAHAHHHHDHDHVHTHEHAHGTAEHHEHAGHHSLPITWRGLFVLGLAGGTVPSASALVVLLSALALGRLGFGLLLILAFGVGMAVVLTSTGVLLVYATRFVARYFPDTGQSAIQRVLTRGVPALSAGIMLLIGVVATLQALGQFGLV